jgi:hypothetical protein
MGTRPQDREHFVEIRSSTEDVWHGWNTGTEGQSGVDDLRASSGPPRALFRVSSTAGPAQRHVQSSFYFTGERP